MTQVKSTLLGCGLSEIINYSLQDHKIRIILQLGVASFKKGIEPPYSDMIERSVKEFKERLYSK